MTETSQIPPPPKVQEVGQEEPRASHRRYLRHLLWGGSGLALLLILGLVAFYFWASSS